MGRYRPRPRLPATAANIEALLRAMQLDSESCGSEQSKQRRRLLLRGARVGLWAAVGKPKLGELAQVLRAELFGYSLGSPVDEDDEWCPPGTCDEVKS